MSQDNTITTRNAVGAAETAGDDDARREADVSDAEDEIILVGVERHGEETEPQIITSESQVEGPAIEDMPNEKQDKERVASPPFTTMTNNLSNIPFASDPAPPRPKYAKRKPAVSSRTLRRRKRPPAAGVLPFKPILAATAVAVAESDTSTESERSGNGDVTKEGEAAELESANEQKSETLPGGNDVSGLSADAKAMDSIKTQTPKPLAFTNALTPAGSSTFGPQLASDFLLAFVAETPRRQQSRQAKVTPTTDRLTRSSTIRKSGIGEYGDAVTAEKAGVDDTWDGRVETKVKAEEMHPFFRLKKSEKADDTPPSYSHPLAPQDVPFPKTTHPFFMTIEERKRKRQQEEEVEARAKKEQEERRRTGTIASHPGPSAPAKASHPFFAPRARPALVDADGFPVLTNILFPPAVMVGAMWPDREIYLHGHVGWVGAENGKSSVALQKKSKPNPNRSNARAYSELEDWFASLRTYRETVDATLDRFHHHNSRIISCTDAQLRSLLSAVYPTACYQSGACLSLYDAIFSSSLSPRLDRSGADGSSWLDRYRPLSVAHHLGNSAHVAYLCEWLEGMRVAPFAAPAREYRAEGDSGGEVGKATEKKSKKRLKKRQRADDMVVFIDSEDSDSNDESTYVPGTLWSLMRDTSSPSSPSDTDRSSDNDFIPPFLLSRRPPRPAPERTGVWSNMILLSGPPGSGKTAAVYACAAEAGYEVFEVHSGHRRAGRDVLAMVGEMAESHLVAFGALMGAAGEIYGGDETERMEEVKEQKGEGKARSVEVENGKRGRGRPKKSEGREKGREKGKAKAQEGAANVIANCFAKMTAKAKTEPDGEAVAAVAAVDALELGPVIDPVPIETVNEIAAPPSVEPSLSKLALPNMPMPMVTPHTSVVEAKQSLILLEEVDVLYEEDKTFWPTVIALAQKSKRPIVMTCNDPSLLPLRDLSLQRTLDFVRPCTSELVPYLHLVCLLEGHFVDPAQLALLCEVMGGDLRRCLAQLEFWIGKQRMETVSREEEEEEEGGRKRKSGEEEGNDGQVAVPMKKRKGLRMYQKNGRGVGGDEEGIDIGHAAEDVAAQTKENQAEPAAADGSERRRWFLRHDSLLAECLLIGPLVNAVGRIDRALARARGAIHTNNAADDASSVAVRTLAQARDDAWVRIVRAWDDQMGGVAGDALGFWRELEEGIDVNVGSDPGAAMVKNEVDIEKVVVVETSVDAAQCDDGSNSAVVVDGDQSPNQGRALRRLVKKKQTPRSPKERAREMRVADQMDELWRTLEDGSYEDAMVGMAERRRIQVYGPDQYEPCKDDVLGHSVVWKSPTGHDHWNEEQEIGAMVRVLSRRRLESCGALSSFMRPVAGRDVGERVVTTARCGQAVVEAVSSAHVTRLSDALSPLLADRTLSQSMRADGVWAYRPYVRDMYRLEEARASGQETGGESKRTRSKAYRRHLVELDGERVEALVNGFEGRGLEENMQDVAVLQGFSQRFRSACGKLDIFNGLEYGV